MTEEEQVQWLMERVWFDLEKNEVHFPEKPEEYMGEISDEALKIALRKVRERDAPKVN